MAAVRIVTKAGEGTRHLRSFCNNSDIWNEEVMDPGTRRSVAYVAARIVTGKTSGSVYDYSAGGHTSMSATISASDVRAYDYGRGAHFSGRLQGRHYSLYDYGRGAHVSLQIMGSKFSGYDYGAGCHFSGTVKSNGSVSLYDYGAGSCFSFSI